MESLSQPLGPTEDQIVTSEDPPLRGRTRAQDGSYGAPSRPLPGFPNVRAESRGSPGRPGLQQEDGPLWSQPEAPSNPERGSRDPVPAGERAAAPPQPRMLGQAARVSPLHPHSHGRGCAHPGAALEARAAGLQRGDPAQSLSRSPACPAQGKGTAFIENRFREIQQPRAQSQAALGAGGVKGRLSRTQGFVCNQVSVQGIIWARN